MHYVYTNQNNSYFDILNNSFIFNTVILIDSNF